MYTQSLEKEKIQKRNKKISMKGVENTLKNLKQYEAKIKEIELQIGDLKDMQYLSLKGINYEEFIRSNQIFSKTETQVLKDLEIEEMIDLLEFEKRHMERFLRRIHNAVESLTDLEKKIIKMKYVDKKIWRYITFEVNIEERQCREIRNEALTKIYKILKNSILLEISALDIPKKCRN
ncbi:hypothetical protein [Inediibacterium massiliense]|uniref:hypothetical protein n=1 Tax=Inediibacterium massiliense TaxID=1658111 RepID=UPI0006B6482D|nr:hypothetical protein [Inediibacterium massiliense]